MGGVVRRLELFGARTLGPNDEPGSWLAEILPAIGARTARHPGNLRYLLTAARTRAERSRVVYGMPSLPYPKWAEDRHRIDVAK